MNSNGPWNIDSQDCATYNVFYSEQFFRRVFPRARVEPPVNGEMQHCAILRKDRVMFTPLPETAIVTVEKSLAHDLLAAAERLPRYENQEFYSTELQARLREHFEQGCDGFEALIGEIGERLSQLAVLRVGPGAVV